MLSERSLLREERRSNTFPSRKEEGRRNTIGDLPDTLRTKHLHNKAEGKGTWLRMERSTSLPEYEERLPQSLDYRHGEFHNGIGFLCSSGTNDADWRDTIRKRGEDLPF